MSALSLDLARPRSGLLVDRFVPPEEAGAFVAEAAR
jgi:hypothetical protein